MYKIKSKFYVIYGDGVPIYIGFTSRTVKQRFSEHKKSKDFSDFDEVRVEELKEDELDFDFTWDYNIVESEADEVSKKEAELVKKFGTQNSKFQKANGGGTVWTHIKYFVLSNKDNPKYRGMGGSEIHEYLENREKEMAILHHFIMHIDYPSTGILHNFIGHIDQPSKVILGSFIGRINYPSKSILSNFVGRINYPRKGILRHFIMNINYPSTIILSNFIVHIDYPSKIILSNFIGNMKIKKEK